MCCHVCVDSSPASTPFTSGCRRTGCRSIQRSPKPSSSLPAADRVELRISHRLPSLVCESNRQRSSKVSASHSTAASQAHIRVIRTAPASCFHIRALRHVRKSLPDDVAKTVACSIVGSRIDYCNALLVGMSDSNFAKLQRVQNTLARVVLGLRKFEHITPALIELHWLPFTQRVTLKLATLTVKTVHSGQPTYLRDLVNAYEPVRTLRSSSQHLLCVGRTRTVTAARSFRHSSATIWNSLPAEIRDCTAVDNFKRKLKTRLFKLAFAA